MVNFKVFPIFYKIVFFVVSFLPLTEQISLLLLFNTQTKIRLQKWYITDTEKNKKKIVKDLMVTVLTRRIPSCNIIEFKEYKIIYQRFVYFEKNMCLTNRQLIRINFFRYANLFFSLLVDPGDNELVYLEIIQRYVHDERLNGSIPLPRQVFFNLFQVKCFRVIFLRFCFLELELTK